LHWIFKIVAKWCKSAKIENADLITSKTERSIGIKSCDPAKEFKEACHKTSTKTATPSPHKNNTFHPN
jgi:hypothetical protein